MMETILAFQQGHFLRLQNLQKILVFKKDDKLHCNNYIPSPAKNFLTPTPLVNIPPPNFYLLPLKINSFLLNNNYVITQ